VTSRSSSSSPQLLIRWCGRGRRRTGQGTCRRRASSRPVRRSRRCSLGTGSRACEPFPHGWSGAGLTLLQRGMGLRYKARRPCAGLDRPRHAISRCGRRGSPRRAPRHRLVAPRRAAHDAGVLLMPDLSTPALRAEADKSVGHPRRLLVMVVFTPIRRRSGTRCPLRERLLLRPAAERYAAEGCRWAVLAGWDAFDRLAAWPARAVVEAPVTDPSAPSPHWAAVRHAPSR
jgi:hypothetical protein